MNDGAPRASERQSRVWVGSRRHRWARLEQRVTALERGRRLSRSELVEVVALYRALGRDVAFTRATLGDSRLAAELERRVFRAHRALFQQRVSLRSTLTRLFRQAIPEAMARTRGAFGLAVGLFWASFVGAWALVSQAPELIGLFASEAMINTVQAGRLWTDDLLNVVPSSWLSMAIMANNLSVAFTAYGLGLFYGIGPLYIIGLNGAMLGAVFAFTAAYGLADDLLRFVVAHGVVELTVIWLAAALGLRLGHALVHPGQEGRGAALRAVTRETGVLLIPVALFLVLAGLIEGFVSPNPEYGWLTRVTLGLAAEGLLLIVLSGGPWRRRRASDSGQGLS